MIRKGIEFFNRQLSDVKNLGFNVVFERLKNRIDIKFHKLKRFLRMPKVLLWNHYFGSSKVAMLESREIVIYTLVFGRHIRFLGQCALRSLYQPGNIPKLVAEGQKIKHLFYTQIGEKSLVEGEIKKFGQIESYEIREMEAGKQLSGTALENCVEYCVRNNCTFLLGCPDLFWGNYALSNLLKLNMNRSLCVAALHLRVDEDKFLNHLESCQGNISNKNLVGLTFKYMHKSAYLSFIDQELGVSKNGGISIQKIDDNMYAVTHRLPTVLLAHFKRGDIRYFRRNGYKSWDHRWPELLMQRGQYKFCGSSSIAYCVELTGHDTHVPGLDVNLGNDDYYDKKFLHKIVNRNFVSILEGVSLVSEDKMLGVAS